MSQLGSVIDEINKLTGYKVPVSNTTIINQAANPIGSGSVNSIIDYINDLTGYEIAATDVQYVSGSNVAGPVIIYTPYAAGGTISTEGILPGAIIRSEHVLRIINALNGVNVNDIIISGSFTASGSNTLDGTFSLPFIPDNKILITSGGFVIGTDTSPTASFANTASFAITASYATNIGYNYTASFVNSPTWVIHHGLNNRIVMIQAYNTTFQQIVPQTIELTDDNTAIITFPKPQSGFAVASVGGAVIRSVESASYASTASYALFAANGGGNTNTGSLVTTSSFNTFTSSYNTGSFNGSFTGSLQGTSSWAISASVVISSSYATTASYALNASSGGPTNLISTGSVTASVNTNGGIFNIVSGSSTFVYVSSSGNVGLGNVPTYSLDVNLGNTKTVRLQSGTGQLNSFLGSAFGNTLISNNVYYNGSTWVYEKTSTAVLLQLGNDGGIILNNYPSQTAGNGLPSPNGIIYMSPAGNVGIGTQTPGYRLDVLGDINVNNLVYLNGSTGNTGEVLTSQGSNPPIWTSPTASSDVPKLILTGVTDLGAGFSYNTAINTLGGNTPGDAFTFTNPNPGEYVLSMDATTPFTSGYTYIMFTAGLPTPGGGNVYNTHYEYNNDSQITFWVKKSDEGYAGVLNQGTIEIRVYPNP